MSERYMAFRKCESSSSPALVETLFCDGENQISSLAKEKPHSAKPSWFLGTLGTWI